MFSYSGLAIMFKITDVFDSIMNCDCSKSYAIIFVHLLIFFLMFLPFSKNVKFKKFFKHLLLKNSIGVVSVRWALPETGTEHTKF